MDGTTRPYEGTEPYIFVSYSHKDSGRVTEIIEALNREGYRVWYDTGIHAGSRWTDEIAQHIDNCAVFLPFNSHNSIQSIYCTREIEYAVHHGKDIVPVYLKKVELPRTLDFYLHPIQHINHYPEPPIASFLQRLELEPMFRPCQEPKPTGQPEPAEQTESEPQTDENRKRPLFILPVLLAVLLAAIAFWPILNRSVDTQEQLPDPVWNLDENGTLTISKAEGSDGRMPDYSWDYERETSTAPWITSLDAEHKILAIVIQDGITTIGNYAFQDCSDAVRISIPYSVTTIGNDAFAGCTRLSKIRIPEGVTSIGDCAFFASGLSEITIPDGVTEIRNCVFAFCMDLTEVFIPDSVSRIQDDAFADCTNLEKASVPAGLSVPERAFPEKTEIIYRQ